MSDETGSRNDNGRPSAAGGLGRRLADAITSLRFAVALVAVIAVACIVGTLLPQGVDEVARYVQAHPESERRLAVFGWFGLTHVYTSWWFVALLGVLSASLGVCTFRRCRVAARARGRQRGRAIGSILTHISMLLILAGGVVRVLTGERGHIGFREGETSDTFIVDSEPRPLPFAVHLAKFETELYEHRDNAPRLLDERLIVSWPEKSLLTALPVALDEPRRVAPEGAAPDSADAVRVTVLRRVMDFVYDTAMHQVRSRSDVPNNPAIQVETVLGTATNTQWLFARLPDFQMHSGKTAPPYKLVYEARVSAGTAPQVKDYKSTLEILEGERVVLTKTIEVNAPLSYKGYRIYQSGFNPGDPKWTSLQVVRDPGVPLVYAGFALMIAGLVVVFYVYPTGLTAASVPTPQQEEV